MQSNELTITRGDGTERKVLGYRFSAEKLQNRKAYSATNTFSKLPPKVDLRPHMTGIENQDQTNSCVANAVWIFMWHYLQFNLTILLMAILLVSLLLIYVRLRKANAAETSNGMRWFVQLPFSVYLGWITVATIANATDVLDFNNWNRFGIAAETWAIILLAVAIAIALWMTLAHRDAPYLAVLAWAFAGIGVKYAGLSIVSTVAYAAAIIVGVLLVAALLLRLKAKTALI